MVSSALNEQGFLFSQLVRDNVRFGVSDKGNVNGLWKYLASEYPVTAADGSQTRIDLLLQHRAQGGIYACMECKRANPLFKQWIFFDKPDVVQTSTDLYFETLRATNRPMVTREEALHGIEKIRLSSQCELFNLYLEVAVNRENKAGYTETIEDAFRQVVKGESGLMLKQLKFRGEWHLRAIPIIVTTAQIFEARFEIKRVKLESGKISAEDLTLIPLDFCAVNYHSDDKLAVNSIHSPPVEQIEYDLFRLTRSVFVVRSEAIIAFLEWLAKSNICKM
jgi:hypothetical protein